MNFFYLVSIISLALGFTACSSDDDSSSDSSNDGCVTCSVSSLGESTSEEVYEGENGNAFVAGVDTEQSFAEYKTGFSLFGGTCE